MVAFPWFKKVQKDAGVAVLYWEVYPKKILNKK
jgi:hypothetical protein